MADYLPKVGDRVRVTETREGVVTGAGSLAFTIRQDNDRGYGSYTYSIEHASVEKLPDPESSEWQPGDVAYYHYWLEVGGEPLVRNFSNDGWICQMGTYYPDSRSGVSAKKLTLLVRDGKPVTDATP